MEPIEDQLNDYLGTFKYNGDTIHRWLDIDAYVLRKGRRGKQ
jgi:hypothetical protein